MYKNIESQYCEFTQKKRSCLQKKIMAATVKMKTRRNLLQAAIAKRRMKAIHVNSERQS